MTCYFVKGKGWRYEFQMNGTRYTKGFFTTERRAKKSELIRREELVRPAVSQKVRETPTDMAFLELVNRRLDHVKTHNSESHFRTYSYLAKRWVRKWEKVPCSQIDDEIVENHLLERRQISAYTANKDLRYLRATFNFGITKRHISNDPTSELSFFPAEKRVKYVPTASDLDRVIALADPDTQDYLWAIRDTIGRVGEINRLRWEDVKFETKKVILYTRKKTGGHLTPRLIPMTTKLQEILSRRYQNRDPLKPWVFWHRYWSRKLGKHVEGPYDDRKKIMRKLCDKAGVRYFRFHPFRHSGATIMAENNVPIGTIQRILGHENSKTTEIYIHSTAEAEADAMRTFEKARQDPTQTPHRGLSNEKRANR